MQILFHGTSIQSARKILKEGFKPRSKNWNVSAQLAYFFKPDPTQSNYYDILQKTLCQGMIAACRHNTEIKRAVIAVQVPESDFSIDVSVGAPPSAIQYNGKVLGPKSIVGFWYDDMNLQPLRFVFLAHHGHHPLSAIKVPEAIKLFQPFIRPYIQEVINVPVKQAFCNFDLGFDFNTAKFKV